MEGFIKKSRFDRIELKYQGLCQKHYALLKKVQKYERLPQSIINDQTHHGIYLDHPYGGIIYIRNTDLTKNHCQVCCKKRKTTGHHIIPKRVPSVNENLKKIKIRVCSECEKKIHPENGYDINKIIEKQNRLIKRQKDKINQQYKEIVKPFEELVNARIDTLVEEIPKIVENLKAINPRAIFPTHKFIEGRIKELKWMKARYKSLANNLQGTPV